MSRRKDGGKGVFGRFRLFRSGQSEFQAKNLLFPLFSFSSWGGKAGFLGVSEQALTHLDACQIGRCQLKSRNLFTFFVYLLLLFSESVQLVARISTFIRVRSCKYELDFGLGGGFFGRKRLLHRGKRARFRRLGRKLSIECGLTDSF